MLVSGYKAKLTNKISSEWKLLLIGYSVLDMEPMKAKPLC